MSPTFTSWLTVSEPRETWVCPKCGHTEDVLPYTSHYEHQYRSGIVNQVHVMKKAK
jgi:hypothetical protein